MSHKQEKRGTTLVPYGLVVGLIAVIAIAAVETTGGSIRSLFGETSDSLQGVASGGAAGASAQSSPDQPAASFDFEDTGFAIPSTVTESAVLQISGFDGVSFSIAGDGSPEIRLCSDLSCSSGSWASSVVVSEGDFVQLRLTSQASDGQTATATVTAGSDNDDWTVTTAASSAEVQHSVNGTWHDVLFVECVPGGGVCNETEAKAACAGVNGQLVTHAGNSSDTVFSLGATHACNGSTGYFRTFDNSFDGTCLIAPTNVDWDPSNCCPLGHWHGGTIVIQASHPVPWGSFAHPSSTGRNSSNNHIVAPNYDPWGCFSETTPAETFANCGGNHVVACKR
ncbi:MAG: hypothetical protein Alpg2KO_07440 [Alphaproteobacteria bacterium]